MTEIPEHLLARSRARREAAGLAQPDAGAAGAASTGGAVEKAAETAPGTTAAARTPAPATAPAPPPPPKPDPPYIQAYKRRKKIPFWAMPALLALPVWAFIYANTLETPPAGSKDPLTLGKNLYAANCSSCHGAAGGGGAGPAFTGGAVVKTWPNFKDHILWVHTGSAKWPSTDGTYGAEKKPIGAGGMPTFGAKYGSAAPLTDAEIVLIVRYEREVLAGAAPEPALVEASKEAATGGDVSTALEDKPSADPTQPAP